MAILDIIPSNWFPMPKGNIKILSPRWFYFDFILKIYDSKISNWAFAPDGWSLVGDMSDVKLCYPLLLCLERNTWDYMYFMETVRG